MESTEARNIRALIENKADKDGNWSVTIDEACDFLGLSRADFHRRLYGHRDKLHTIAPEVITRDNLFVLIAGSCDNVDECESELQRTGISLSVEDRIRLSERYLFAVSNLVENHTIDRDTFLRMVDYFGTESGAAKRYVEHFIDLEELIEPTARELVDESPGMIRHLAFRTAVEYLHLLFERNIFSPQRLLEPLIRKLLPEREETGRKETGRPGQRVSPIERAVTSLGLHRLPDTIDELRRRYRTLMKTYHPDINPRGTEITQTINSAYTLLLQELRDGDGR